jgi:IclR family acetate operon transcriptional repressor
VVAVIERLAVHGPGSVRGLSRDLDIPLGSTHRLLAALAAEGVVERTANDDWRLTYRLLGIVGHQLRNTGLPGLARPVLEGFADVSGQTAFLATSAGHEVVYLDKVQGQAQVQLHVELGTRRPAHATALGKAMLAFATDAEREDFLTSAELTPLTPDTITDAAVLRDELAVARSRGYATDQGEVVGGVSCLAAPVFDHVGAVVGAVSIAGPDPRLRDEDAELVQLVVAGAGTVSERLGYAAPE